MYKIVPNLEKGEFDRERKFYSDRGLPCPKDQIAEESEEAAKEDKMTPDANTNMDFHRFDELVSLLLECKESSVVASSPGNPSDRTTQLEISPSKAHIASDSVVTLTQEATVRIYKLLK